MDEKQTFHVFIVPDGNRRWAEKRDLFSVEGHRQGYRVFKNIMRSIWDLDVTHFTFWALSHDNVIKRSKEEIGFLSTLLKIGIQELRESPEFTEKDIRFKATGKYLSLSPDLVDDINNLEQETANRKGSVFTLLIVYDGREDLIHSGFKISENISSFMRGPTETIRKHLLSAHLPDVDLYIRTGEEQSENLRPGAHMTHLSANALMWQMRNPALYSTETFWPDFNVKELKEAIDAFHSRERRYGA